MQVGERRPFWIHHVTSALDGARSASDHDCRQWTVSVAVAVAESRAVQDDRVVEQRSFGVGRRPQFLEKCGEERRVMGLDRKSVV